VSLHYLVKYECQKNGVNLKCVLSRALSSFLAVCWPGAQSAWDNHALVCNFAIYSPIKKNFTPTLSNKLVLICLLTTPPHLQYVATVPCNLSSVACFADINVSQGSVATYVRCGGIFDSHLTANLLRNLPVKTICKSVKIWQNYDHESVAPFLAHPVCSMYMLRTLL